MGCRPSKADFIGDSYCEGSRDLDNISRRGYRHGNCVMRKCHCGTCRSRRMLPHTNSFPVDAHNRIVTSDNWIDSRWQSGIGTASSSAAARSSGSSLSYTRDFSTVTSVSGRSTIRVTLLRDGSMIEVEKYETPETDPDDIDLSNSAESPLIGGSCHGAAGTSPGAAGAIAICRARHHDINTHYSLPNLKLVDESSPRNCTGTDEPVAVSRETDPLLSSEDSGVEDAVVDGNGCDSGRNRDRERRQAAPPMRKLQKSRAICCETVVHGYHNEQTQLLLPRVDVNGECSNSMLSPQSDSQQQSHYSANCQPDDQFPDSTDQPPSGHLDYHNALKQPQFLKSEDQSHFHNPDDPSRSHDPDDQPQSHDKRNGCSLIVVESNPGNDDVDRPLFTIQTPELSRASSNATPTKLPPIKSTSKLKGTFSSPSFVRDLLQLNGGGAGGGASGSSSAASSNVSSAANTPKLKCKKGFDKCKHSSLDLPGEKSRKKTPQKSNSSGWLSKLNKDKDADGVKTGSKSNGTPKTPKKSLSSDWLSRLTSMDRGRNKSADSAKSKKRPFVKAMSDEGGATGGSSDYHYTDAIGVNDSNAAENVVDVHLHEEFFRDFGDIFDDEADFAC
ncbi:uncharacterized protein LOC141902933 [Tubulanus polymorphus]|uniref:uncharacterized protein LOC141902933 n=1 Tax=Tubulanus polymorphus TaxID=672921 RepID=UPI003DA3427F